MEKVREKQRYESEQKVKFVQFQAVVSKKRTYDDQTSEYDWDYFALGDDGRVWQRYIGADDWRPVPMCGVPGWE